MTLVTHRALSKLLTDFKSQTTKGQNPTRHRPLRSPSILLSTFVRIGLQTPSPGLDLHLDSNLYPRLENLLTTYLIHYSNLISHSLFLHTHIASHSAGGNVVSMSPLHPVAPRKSEESIVVVPGSELTYYPITESDIQVIIVLWVLFLVTSIFVGLRLYSRVKILQFYALEDYLYNMAFVSFYYCFF